MATFLGDGSRRSTACRAGATHGGGVGAVLASERTATLTAIWDRRHLSQRRVSQWHELLPGGAAPRSHADVGAGRTGAYAPSSRGDLPWSPQQVGRFAGAGRFASGAYAPQGLMRPREANAPPRLMRLTGLMRPTRGAYAPPRHSRRSVSRLLWQAVLARQNRVVSAPSPTRTLPRVDARSHETPERRRGGRARTAGPTRRRETATPTRYSDACGRMDPEEPQTKGAHHAM